MNELEPARDASLRALRLRKTQAGGVDHVRRLCIDAVAAQFRGGIRHTCEDILQRPARALHFAPRCFEASGEKGCQHQKTGQARHQRGRGSPPSHATQ